MIDSNDYSTYHALQVLVQRKFSKGVQFQGSYTFGKSLDTRSFDPAFTIVGTGNTQQASSTPFDNNRRYLNYARRTSTGRSLHRLRGLGPALRQGQMIGADLPGFANAMIAGWNINGVMTLQKGRPFTVYSGANQVSNVINATADCNNCPRDMGEVDLTGEQFRRGARLFHGRGDRALLPARRRLDRQHGPELLHGPGANGTSTPRCSSGRRSPSR